MYRVISHGVPPPLTSDSDLAAAQAGVKICPDDAQDVYRLQLLRACAVRIEHRTERLWWPAGSQDDPPVAADRACSSVVSVTFDDVDRWDKREFVSAVPWVPAFPETPAPAADPPGTVHLWQNDAWAAQTVKPTPTGGWLPPGDGTYRVDASPTPGDIGPPPPEVLEALARLWGYLDSRRGIWSSDEGALNPPSVAGAIYKSGAAAALLPLRRPRA